MPANTAAPETPASRSARNSADGFGTGTRPRSAISNTPISLAAPKRFLTARRMRNWWADGVDPAVADPDRHQLDQVGPDGRQLRRVSCLPGRCGSIRLRNSTSAR